MLNAYADEHVKSAIVDGLRHLGLDIVTAQDRGQRQTDDEVLLLTATSEGRLLLTNDTDFLRIHAEWARAARPHAGIVYWHQDRPIGDTIRRIHAYAIQTNPESAANAVKFA